MSETDLFHIEEDALQQTVNIGSSGSITSTVTAKQPLRLSNKGWPGTTDPEYGMALSGTCPAPFGSVLMDTGDTCTIEFSWAPQTFYSLTMGWNFTATPIDASGAPSGPAISAEIDMNGQPGIIETQPVAFPAHPIGSPAAVSELLIHNTSTVDATITKVRQFGSAYEFDVADRSAFPISLPAGETAIVPVVFAPRLEGPASGRFQVLATVPGKHGPIHDAAFYTDVTGTGTPAAAPDVTTDDVDFGNVNLGETAHSTFIIRNGGTGDARVVLANEAELIEAGITFDKTIDHILPPGDTLELPISWTTTESTPHLNQQLSITDLHAVDSETGDALIIHSIATGTVTTPAPTPPATETPTPGSANTSSTNRLATTGIDQDGTFIAIALAATTLATGIALSLVRRRQNANN